MSDIFNCRTPKMPYGKLGLIVLESSKELGAEINKYLICKRKAYFSDESSDDIYLEKCEDNYIIDAEIVRFSNGEGKAVLDESVRGKDIYIIADIGNYNCTYEMFGRTTCMGPDIHFQDIKRMIHAVGGKARRISVIMPLLYASRQDRRKRRESLDCSIALKELEALGVNNIITFDAHEPKVMNAVPLLGFESLHSSYGILRCMFKNLSDLNPTSSNMMVVSPDSGAMDRAIYYANMLELDVGLFYKRRDYSRLQNGKYPVVQHEYMGADIEGKDILVVDDMIASGQTVLDLCVELKKRGASRIFIGVTFAFFTEGLETFDKYYEDGMFDNVISTNLSYIPDILRERKWFLMSNMSKHVSNIIHRLNYDESISSLIGTTSKILELLKKKE